MIKAIGSFFLCLTLAVPVVAAVLKDGVYTGQSNGYKGPVRVQVTVKDGKISAVDVTHCRDSRARKVMKEIPRRIVSTNSVDVDVISGATITSQAIKSAVRKALEEAR